MRRVLWMVIFLATFIMASPANSEEAKVKDQAGMAADLLAGEKLYNTHCAACHGEKAAGTTRGPSFLSQIYKPDHHGDESFLLAAMNGVRSHHWNFGNMPPVPGITPNEVRKVVGYVRWLQNEAWKGAPKN